MTGVLETKTWDLLIDYSRVEFIVLHGGELRKTASVRSPSGLGRLPTRQKAELSRREGDRVCTGGGGRGGVESTERECVCVCGGV